MWCDSFVLLPLMCCLNNARNSMSLNSSTDINIYVMYPRQAIELLCHRFFIVRTL